MDKLYIGLLGLGTVGGGTAEIILQHQEKMQAILGKEVVVKAALVKSVDEVTGPLAEQIPLTESLDDILNDPEIAIVAELMGGIDFPKHCIEEALNAGKHVVTANKDLIAVHGASLSHLAQEKGLDLYYEAAVAGGIPILRALSNSLVADELVQVRGILNGTTNYILSRMTQEGADYARVLKDAQELGFAEADPTADVEGLDAARKVVILTKMAFGAEISLDDLPIQGISQIKQADIQVAKQLGYTIKLLGSTSCQDGQIYAEVAPTLVPNSHPLATVNAEMNAVYTVGQASGELMFYGAGAGALPTGSAVVADIIAIGRNMNESTVGAPFARFNRASTWSKAKDVTGRAFFRFKLVNQTGSFARLTELFAKANISLAHVLQLPSDSEEAEVVVVTDLMTMEEKAYLLELVEEANQMACAASYNVLD